MSTITIDRIRGIYPAALDKMVGYSPEEMRKIERLYGITISGELASFMELAGRSDGGVIGDDPIIFYRSYWPVRTHILFQVNFFNSLQEISAWDYLNAPFVFSLESETQFFFLQTGLKGDDFVYHYDDNAKTVKRTEMTFSAYLLDVLNRYPVGGAVCRGDLLEI